MNTVSRAPHPTRHAPWSLPGPWHTAQPHGRAVMAAVAGAWVRDGAEQGGTAPSLHQLPDGTEGWAQGPISGRTHGGTGTPPIRALRTHPYPQGLSSLTA